MDRQPSVESRCGQYQRRAPEEVRQGDLVNVEPGHTARVVGVNHEGVLTNLGGFIPWYRLFASSHATKPAQSFYVALRFTVPYRPERMRTVELKRDIDFALSCMPGESPTILRITEVYQQEHVAHMRAHEMTPTEARYIGATVRRKGNGTMFPVMQVAMPLVQVRSVLLGDVWIEATNLELVTWPDGRPYDRETDGDAWPPR